MPEVAMTVKRSQVAAAKLRLTLDRKAGRKSSAAVRAIASARPNSRGSYYVLSKS